MESLSQDKHVKPLGELQYDKEHLATLQAAMMVSLITSFYCLLWASCAVVAKQSRSMVTNIENFLGGTWLWPERETPTRG